MSLIVGLLCGTAAERTMTTYQLDNDIIRTPHLPAYLPNNPECADLILVITVLLAIFC